jgi:hypothetical protein
MSPLKKGRSKSTIRKNVREMISAPSERTKRAARTRVRGTGKPYKQALAEIATAAAHSTARKSKKRKVKKS